MNDSERIHRQDFLHLLMAIRSKKENRNETEYCIRRVIRDEEQDLAILEREVANIKGTWRIYHTVNARDPQMALKTTLAHLILHPEDASRVDSIWKTQLMKPTCKAERKYLIDIDTNEQFRYENTKKLLNDANVQILHEIKTPNGWHIITEKFDTRLIHDLKDIELHRDRYYYIKSVKGKDD